MKLYHGSKYRHDELKPGFMHTGEERNWDNTESNKFLYATAERRSAVDMGFASYVDQSYLVARFQSKEDGSYVIHIEDGPIPSREDLEKITVYVYTIVLKDKDGWVKVNNAHNNMDSEYKTEKVVPKTSIEQVQPVRMSDWLKGKKITVIGPSKKPAWSGW